MTDERIADLLRQIDELKQRWPAHSASPAMMEELDYLEEQLSLEQNKLANLNPVGELASPVSFVPIGLVENEVQNPLPPDSFTEVESRIVLNPDLAAGLTGLTAGQKILVVFWFHRAVGYDLLQHPRGDPTQPRRGVFALRSPYRPNPIGVTVVDLLAVEGSILRVRGLDAINGTPVLDIKLE